MATTTFLYELLSNANKTLVYKVETGVKPIILRFDLSLTKGRDTRIYMQGEDKRWVLLLEDNYYERADNSPNKMQQNKIIGGELTKELAEQQNEQMRTQRRNEKMGFYFECLTKIL